ncbi:hypothetical protein QTO34_018220 [Cnephaeus nilssonii]|uniref:Solute carrier family 22 member 23 n=1 Tax=Cnephaeus nilssonii TaxID=3371016 RepID=A0AA40HZ57_CNENI|nr:hypothetical protein QTO34_018220 [Eptesicus nilssonii]
MYNAKAGLAQWIERRPADSKGQGPREPDSAESLLHIKVQSSILQLHGDLMGSHRKGLIALTGLAHVFISGLSFLDTLFSPCVCVWCRALGGGGGLADVALSAVLKWNREGKWLPQGRTAVTHTVRTAGVASSSGDACVCRLPYQQANRCSNLHCRALDAGSRTGNRQNNTCGIDHQRMLNPVGKCWWQLQCGRPRQCHGGRPSFVVTLVMALLGRGCHAPRSLAEPALNFTYSFITRHGQGLALRVLVGSKSTARAEPGAGYSCLSCPFCVPGIELCPPGKRFMITMVASFVAMAGQLLMPGLAALCRDWQVLQALIICPFLLMLLYWSVFPESLRWLMATQQFESAKKLILHFTQKNSMNTETDIKGVMPELEKELSRRPKKVCIVKMVGTRNLWKNIVVLCVNSLTGFGIHHCFARSMMGHEVKVPLLENFYADYYTMASIALASCLAMCVVVRFLGRRGGLLLFMILTALASLLQLGLLNLIGKYSQHPDSGMSDSVKDKFSIAFSIVGMFASHAVGSLSVFFCAEITPTVIRCGGLGLVLASAGFGMLTAPIIELHNQKGYFLHHIIFACCTLICIICILLLPESRNQSLPESLSNGEHYTRQPLLPHKKAEQPLLLTNAELKDYSGLHDAAAAGDVLPDSAAANGVRSLLFHVSM